MWSAQKIGCIFQWTYTIYIAKSTIKKIRYTSEFNEWNDSSENIYDTVKIIN